MSVFSLFICNPILSLWAKVKFKWSQTSYFWIRRYVKIWNILKFKIVHFWPKIYFFDPKKAKKKTKQNKTKQKTKQNKKQKQNKKKKKQTNKQTHQKNKQTNTPTKTTNKQRFLSLAPPIMWTLSYKDLIYHRCQLVIKNAHSFFWKTYFTHDWLSVCM